VNSYKKTKAKMKIINFFISLVVFLLLSNLGFSQPSFNGVNAGQNLEVTISEFEEKGFVESFRRGNLVSMQGMVNGSKMDVFVVFTPESKLVWKIQVIAEEKSSWISAKTSFFKFCDILTEKWGPAPNKYTFFKEPYYEGDGYELQALRVDKAVYFYSWDVPGGSISVRLRSYQYGISQVHISYENIEASKIDTEEKSKQDKKTF